MQVSSYMPRKKTAHRADKKKAEGGAQKKEVPKEENISSKKDETKRRAETKVPKKQAKQSAAENPYVIAGIAIAALLIGIGVGYVLLGVSGGHPAAKTAGTTKAIVLFDDKCSVCNSELNRVLAYLKDQMDLKSLDITYVSASSKAGKKILSVLKEYNEDRVPAIVFEGNITSTDFYKKFDQMTKQYGGAARFIRKVGEYYVLQPAWTTRIYAPAGGGDKVVVYAAPDVSRDAVERIIYLVDPKANLKIEKGSGDYLIKVEAPSEVLQKLKLAFPISSVNGNTMTVPYIHVKVSAQKDFLQGVMQAISGISNNIKIDGTKNLPADSNYLAVIETDHPDLLAGMLKGWSRDGNRFYVMKSEKPKVELFVMSYCPFGLQTEKAILPVLKLLGNRVDFYLRFVNYSMHGNKEVWENLRQYCIQFKVDQNKFLDYLQCFTEKGDANACMAELNIDKNAVQACMKAEDKKYGITKILNNPGSWGSRFPPFPIDNALNEKYGVQGSPTLVINGIVVPAPRNPEGLKELICAAFLNPPEACKQKLSSENESPGFGAEKGGSTGGTCG